MIHEACEVAGKPFKKFLALVYERIGRPKHFFMCMYIPLSAEAEKKKRYTNARSNVSFTPSEMVPWNVKKNLLS